MEVTMLDIMQRQERYRQFYADPRPGQILILASYADAPATQPLDFREYDFARESEHRRYWDRLIADYLVQAAYSAEVDDDWMPGLEIGYGFGSFGAVYCDAPLSFTENTSYIAPALERLEDMDAIDLTQERFWARVFVAAASYLSRRSEGRFLVGVYPNPSPMDVANLLRGNGIFTDLFEQPDLFRRFLERCLNAAVVNMQRIARATHNTGGGCMAFGRWIPHGAVLLEDAADLISPRTYREFGMPYTQRMIDAMGGAYLHHHSLGQQQFANIAGLRGLYVEQISSDPGCRRPVTYVEEVYRHVGGMAIDLEVTPEEVYEHIAQLQKGKVILSVHTATRAEAVQLVRFVQQHRLH
jgi:Uroporphyrinogen decarboxylase (URO-D)